MSIFLWNLFKTDKVALNNFVSKVEMNRVTLCKCMLTLQSGEVSKLYRPTIEGGPKDAHLRRAKV